MRLEAVRMLAAALAHEAIGVNEMLALVPLDAGDPLPPDVDIVEETTTGWAARDEVPNEVARARAVLAVASSPARYPLTPQRTALGANVVQAEVPLIIRYIDRTKALSEDGSRNMEYVLRAVRLTLVALHDGPYEGLRQRNGVALLGAPTIAEARFWAAKGDTAVAGAILPTYTVWESVVKHST